MVCLASGRSIIGPADTTESFPIIRLPGTGFHSSLVLVDTG